MKFQVVCYYAISQSVSQPLKLILLAANVVMNSNFVYLSVYAVDNFEMPYREDETLK